MTENPLHILIRETSAGLHARLTFYVGLDADHRAFAGTLTLDSWQADKLLDELESRYIYDDEPLVVVVERKE